MKLDWYVRRQANPELSFKIPVKPYTFDTSERRAFLPTPPRNLLQPPSRDMRQRLADIYIDDEMKKMREKEQRSKGKAANIAAAIQRQDQIIAELQGGRVEANAVAANNVAAIDAVRAEFPNVVGAVGALGGEMRANIAAAVGSEKSMRVLESATGRKPDPAERSEIIRRLGGDDSTGSKREYLLSDILRVWVDMLDESGGSPPAAGRPRSGSLSSISSASTSGPSLSSSIQASQRGKKPSP